MVAKPIVFFWWTDVQNAQAPQLGNVSWNSVAELAGDCQGGCSVGEFWGYREHSKSNSHVIIERMPPTFRLECLLFIKFAHNGKSGTGNFQP